MIKTLCPLILLLIQKKLRLSERDSSGCRPKGGSTKQRAKRLRRYERSEPRIARREPQKKPTLLCSVGFFCARSGSPYFKLKIKNDNKLTVNVLSFLCRCLCLHRQRHNLMANAIKTNNAFSTLMLAVVCGDTDNGVFNMDFFMLLFLIENDMKFFIKPKNEYICCAIFS